MSQFSQAFLLNCRTPLTQFQRFRGKINIQRPRQPHYERAKVLAVTSPQKPNPIKTLTCFQPNPKRTATAIENPYNDIIAREVTNWLHNSRMVCIFHLNSINQDDLFTVRVKLHRQNMHLKSYGKKIIAKAVQGTRFETIVSLFDAQHCLVFSPEQRIAQLLRIIRRTPQMLLLAGIVDDTLLSRNELVAYAQLPGLEHAQAELVTTLNAAASNCIRQLETHQNNFANVLDVYAKSGGGDGGEVESVSHAAGESET